MGKTGVVIGAGVGAVAGGVIARVIADVMSQQVPESAKDALKQFSFFNPITGSHLMKAKVISKKLGMKYGTLKYDLITFGLEERFDIVSTDPNTGEKIQPDNDFMDVLVKLWVMPELNQYRAAIVQLGNDTIEVRQNGVLIGTLDNPEMLPDGTT